MIFITGPLFAGKRDYIKTALRWTEEDLRQNALWDVQDLAARYDDLTALADRVHFHPVYLSRMYKETMGVSLSDHIAEARMNVVCGMLKDTRTPISEISRQMGFSSANYFARWFKKRMGVTPQEYRERR